jgi:hypothetical protein
MERLSQAEEKQWLHKALKLTNFEIANSFFCQKNRVA